MKRKKIALIFSYNEQWIGGTYYITNLIAAIGILPDKDQPELIILSDKKDFHYLCTTVNYPYLTFDELNENPDSKLLKTLNRVSQRLIKKKIFKRRFIKEVLAVFPFRNVNYLEKVPVEKRIYWIPDFQEKHYPEFYSQEHLKRELEVNTKIVTESKKLLLSSQDAENDLKKYYPNYTTTPFVVHFAVDIPKKSDLDSKELLRKFELPEEFYLSPNQFWRHKNQILVIQAVEILKSQGIDVCVAFSGKENDPRSPKYTDELKSYVRNNNLTDNIKFLGFIERSEQLKLLEICRAVVQPSLFEGWSTVIEEGMAFNKLVLASDLPVNKEQLSGKGIYFERNNAIDLAEKLKHMVTYPNEIDYQYLIKQNQFAQDFLACVNA
jgi:glycosyltransferase involved in cell wall biosynthesis